MRAAGLSPTLAILLAACSLLGPQVDLDCSDHANDPQCPAVLSAAVKLFPKAVGARMLEGPQPGAVGETVWFVNVIFPQHETQDIRCARMNAGPVICEAPQ
jgi:hypothetical protein